MPAWNLRLSTLVWTSPEKRSRSPSSLTSQSFSSPPLTQTRNSSEPARMRIEGRSRPDSGKASEIISENSSSSTSPKVRP